MVKPKEYIQRAAQTAFLTGAALIGGAAGLSGQEAERNPIVSGDYCNSVTGDGSALRNLCYDVDLNPDLRYDLNEVLDLGTLSGGDVTYNVLNLKEGLTNLISRIRNGSQTDLTHASIEYYQRILNSVGTEINEPDVYSETRLQRSLEDGVIDVEGENLFNPSAKAYHTKDGLYAIRVDSENKNQSHYVFLRLKSSPEEPRPEREINQEERPEPQVELVGENSYQPRIARENIERQERRKARADRVAARFSLDATRSLTDSPNTAGGQFGIGYGPLSLVLNYSESKDQNMESLEVPLNNGRKGVGSTDRIDRTSFGAALEANLGPVFVGAGANLNNYTTNVIERIVMANGDVLRDNTLSKSESEISKRFYGGLNIDLTDNLSLRVLGGHDTQLGNFGGIGASVKTHKPQNQAHRTQDRGNR